MVLTLQCDDNRRLRAMSHDRRLDVWQRMAIFGHAIACGPCRRFTQGMRRINRSARRIHATVAEPSATDENGTAAALDRIRRRVERAVSADDSGR